MSNEESIIGVALKAGEELLVYAEGNPAQVVAVGVTAAAVVVAVGCIVAARNWLGGFLMDKTGEGGMRSSLE